MGWTGTYKYKDESIQDFVNREVKYISGYERIGKGFFKNGAFYSAVKNTNTGEIFAEIILINYEKKKNDHINIYYKEENESMGPYKYDCPDRILDILTAPPNDWAADWRKKCREQNAKKQNKVRVKKEVKK